MKIRKITPLLIALLLSVSSCNGDDTSSSSNPSSSSSGATTSVSPSTGTSSTSIVPTSSSSDPSSSGSSTTSGSSSTSGSSVTSSSAPTTSPSSGSSSSSAPIPVDPSVPENKLKGFINSIKANHNYTMSMTSYAEDDPSDVLNIDFVNLNDKAFYVVDDYGIAEGYIYQKDQGFVSFDQYAGGSIHPDYFMSTNKYASVSELVPTSLEQILKASYEQDLVDFNKFIIEDTTAITVCLNQTGFLGITMVIAPESMTLSVDDSNDSFKMNIDFQIAHDMEFYDAHASFVIHSINTTINEPASAYIENPTRTWSKPTAFRDSDLELFEKYYNKYVPPFLPEASYAFDMYKGGETSQYNGVHFFIEDLASGDQSEAYGNLLVADGFVKQSDTYYLKTVNNEETAPIDKYEVWFDYVSPSYKGEGQIHETGYYNPNGIFSVEFHYDTTNNVNSVATLNEYIVKNDLRRYVPLYPEGKSTSVYGFRDRTEAMNQIYGGGFIFSTKGLTGNFFDINYASGDDAKADVNEYISRLASRGYTDVNKISGALAIANPNSSSTAPSQVWITDPDAISSSTTKVQLRYSIYNWDVIPDDPDGPAAKVLNSITLNTSAVQKTFNVDEGFNYNNLVVTAHYSDGSSSVVSPTSITGGNTSSAGTKTVTVSYTEGGVTKAASYQISVISAGMHQVTYNVVDEWGNPLLGALNESASTLPLNGSYSDIVNISVVANAGYTYQGFSFPINYFDDDYFMDYFNTHDYEFTESEFAFRMSSFDVQVNLVFSENSTPVSYHSVSFNKDSHVYISSSADFSHVAVGDTVSFELAFDSGYEVNAVTSSDVSINKNGNVYSFVMVDKDVSINVSSKESAHSSYHKITFDVDSHITAINASIYGIDPDAVEANTQVTFSVTIADGYEIDTYAIDVEGTEFQINLMTRKSFTFWMPDQDVTITLRCRSTGDESGLQYGVNYDLIVPMSNPAYYNKYSLNFNSNGTGTYIRTVVNGAGTSSKSPLNFTYTYNESTGKISLTLVSGDNTDAVNGYRLFTDSNPGSQNPTGLLNDDGTITISLCYTVHIVEDPQPYTFTKAA